MKRHAAVVLLTAALFVGAACGGGSKDPSPLVEAGAGRQAGGQPTGSQTTGPADTGSGNGTAVGDATDGSAGLFFSDVPQISMEDWAVAIQLLDEHTDVQGILSRALSSPHAPAELLALAAEIEWRYGLGHVAENPNTPVDVIRLLAADWKYDAAGNPSAPADVLRSIANDPGGRSRRLATHPNTPSDVLRFLAADPDLAESVAANPNTPGDVLARIAADPEQSSELRRAAAANPSLPADLLARLADDVDRWLTDIGDRPICSSSASSGMAPAPERAPTEAPYDATPDPVPEMDRDLLAGVAANPSTPAGLLSRLAATETGYTHVVVANPSTPADSLRLLADCGLTGYWMGRAAATNPNAPADILELLANSENDDVREAAAKHPNTPGDMLELLAIDPDPGVREAAAANPSTPAATLEQLAATWDTSEEAANNPSTPESAAFEVWLQTDQDRLVERYGYLTDRALARIAEKALSSSRPQLLAAMVAFHPDTPTSTIEELAASPSESIRALAATSPYTPDSLLDTLSRDAHPDVRRAATAEQMSRAG